MNAYELVALMLGFFVIATLYSSVGFGGGSSYLALLTLVLTSFFAIRTTSLVCNLVVVSGSCYLYYKNGHLDFKKFLPFVLSSIPMAFIGASFRLKEQVFFIVLGVSLILSALALIYQTYITKKSEEINSAYPPYATYFFGGAIGLLSGMVGIGGGIFLAPVLNHLRWDKAIKIAALASFFILVNSISGLIGLLNKGTFELPWREGTGLIIAVFIGGQLGIRISLGKFTGKSIQLVTGILVLFVGVRVLVVNGLKMGF